MGRKSNATLAAEAAAKAAEELAKIETVDGEKVVTDLEPKSEGSVSASVDPNGEDLGDVSSDTTETPVIVSGELGAGVATAFDTVAIVDPTEAVVDGEQPSEAPEQDTDATPEQQAITEAINQEIVAELIARATDPELIQEYSQTVAGKAFTEVTALPEGKPLPSGDYKLEDDFKPILRPTMVGDNYTGHIACPKAVFDLVQTEGWQDLIDLHPAKHGLKSVLYWKNINGSAVVRCMSSSKFADVV